MIIRNDFIVYITVECAVHLALCTIIDNKLYITGTGNSNLTNDTCVLNQLNIVNCQCLVFVHITAICIVCIDCVLVSCHIYIMETRYKTRYDVTVNNFME